jgi:hypothetical protein
LFSFKADLNLQAFLHQEKPFTGFYTRSMLSLRIVRLAGNGKPFYCATGNMTKKEGANDCCYSSLQAPQRALIRE